MRTFVRSAKRGTGPNYRKSGEIRSCPLLALLARDNRLVKYLRPGGLLLLAAVLLPGADSFRFVLLGDRTGETQPGIYARVWQEVARENPAFVVSVGDTIPGLRDDKAESEWMDAERVIAPYSAFLLYLAPGNHDVWSPWSESLFRKYSGHALHYSFDYMQAHFTILDNSRSDQFSPGELTFLEADLQAHAAQPLKFIVSHRPSWLVDVIMNQSDFALHRIAKKYGVQYVIAGHVHEMLHADLDGVSYTSLPSAGGGLRATKKYEDGWFFGYTVVEAGAKSAEFQVKELKAPYGSGRVSELKAWGKSGLVIATAEPERVSH